MTLSVSAPSAQACTAKSICPSRSGFTAFRDALPAVHQDLDGHIDFAVQACADGAEADQVMGWLERVEGVKLPYSINNFAGKVTCKSCTA